MKPLDVKALQPYSNKNDRLYANAPYDLIKHNIIEMFDVVDREHLKNYVDRAWSEYFNENHPMR